MDRDLATAVWGRLVKGGRLDNLGLSEVDGRVDLRGFAAPDPSASHFVVIRGVHWKNLDFSKARFGELRIVHSNIENCSFDGAACSGWRVWATAFSRVTFRSTDLRSAVLGGIEDGKRNTFDNVDFARADLRRRTVHKSAEMRGCRFANTKLKGVDFQGMVFTDCVFEGELKEVQFYRHAFRGEAFPPNQMSGVDFRRARFKDVEFRGLDMDNVRWPEGPDHFVVNDYPATLDRLLAVWGARTDTRSRVLAAHFGLARKWAGPRQTTGVVSKADLLEAGGEEAVEEFLRLTSASHANEGGQ